MYLQSKYVATAIWLFSENKCAVLLREIFRPWEEHARQDTLTKRPPGAAYLINGSLFCVFLNKN